MPIASPLSPPAPRRKLHTRTITIDGFEREDGLFDVEAHLTDVKTETFLNADRGHVAAFAPLHEMFVRLTFDHRMTITGAEAVTSTGPFRACASAADSYANLVGLRIKPGFLREANARMAGPIGCTHLREMLQEIATTAFQTMWPVRAQRRAAAGKPEEDDSALIDTCHAYAADGPVVAAMRSTPGP